MNKYNKSIFIFRRDFRLYDNIGLINCLKSSNYVIPIFILTPEQLVNNRYKSNNCVQFMIESLINLNNQLNKYNSKLYYFYGKPNLIIKDLLTQDAKINAVFVNMDYTKYSVERDNNIKDVCDNLNVDFNSYEDILLYPINSIVNKQNKIYSKFTPYFNTAKNIKIPKPLNNNYNNYVSKRTKIKNEYNDNIHKFYKYNENIAQNGGRLEALKILDNIKDFKNYNNERNMLDINTTRLSAYLKFGCVSIREAYHKIKDKLGSKNDLLKQLHWRDFYYNVGYNNLNLFIDKLNLKEKYDEIKWINLKTANKKQINDWNKWTSGNTGFPVVDACMTELNTTGFLHNRGRLIVASFLIKNMFWDWVDGEKYFANVLIDYDPNVNFGNWLWVAGSGVDSQPYFRIFNPWKQQEKYDPQCHYIKKFIPELRNIPIQHIHKWNDYYQDYPDINYPNPMLDYSDTAEKTIQKYKKALN